MKQFRLVSFAQWLFLIIIILFLYAPLLPPTMKSFDGVEGAWVSYQALFSDEQLLKSLKNSGIASAAAALIAPFIALVAAQLLRKFQTPGVILGIILIPLFVPGVSMGVSTALFFKLLSISPSIASIIAVQTLWALPFAFLVIVTVMASFDQVYLEAAYMSGRGPVQAFLEVELPQIHHGITGAIIFSFIISFNETIRTSIVQGGNNTVQTYIWSHYQQIGLSPKLFALMTILIVITLLLIFILAFVDFKRAKK